MEAPFVCLGRFHVDGMWMGSCMSGSASTLPNIIKVDSKQFFIYKVLISISSQDLIWGVLHLTYTCNRAETNMK